MAGTLALVVAVCLLSGRLFAADAVSWRQDDRRGGLGFTFYLMEQLASGVFRRWQTQINFSPDRLSTASIVAEIDPAGVTLENSTQAAALLSQAWFDVDRYPTARFIALDVRALSGGGITA